VPGLLGIVGGAQPKDISGSFSSVLAAMQRDGRLVSETRIDRGQRWALGRVHLGVLQPAPQLATDDDIRVVFHGDLSNQADLQAILETLGEPPANEPARLLAALYRRRGPEFARDLKGQFCAAIHDESAGQLLLVSDRFGSYPLYWFNTPERFVFASELRAALRAHPRPCLNGRAVSDLLKFAFPLGDKTLAAGVHLLPPSSVLAYRWQDETVRITRYASTADMFQSKALDQREYLETVQRAFAAAIHCAVSGSHRYGLSLSGGLDTRVILSALDRVGCNVSTFTLGGRGCADEVIADELARMAHSTHRFVALDDRYLDDLLPTTQKMVSATDGMYVTHGFTEMLALQALEESDCSILLRGHAGELAKASTAWPFHTDSRIYEMQSTEEFVCHLLTRLNHVSRGEAVSDVLTDAWIEEIDGDGPRRSLEQVVEGVRLSPPDLCSYVYLHEYHRRVTIPSLEIFRNAVEVRLPLADVEFVEAVLQGPPRWRDGVTIHQALIAGNNADYLRVRNPNTGAPAGAGPLKEAVLDKVNTILRRLNVYGYRHYHSFDGWMRRALLDVVERVLLDPNTLARGVFRESAIRQRVAEARGGVRDYDDLLQALVIVELWQRENL
jgi:asparagine synthase (glutamine-hydrolysing)